MRTGPAMKRVLPCERGCATTPSNRNHFGQPTRHLSGGAKHHSPNITHQTSLTRHLSPIIIHQTSLTKHLSPIITHLRSTPSAIFNGSPFSVRTHDSGAVVTSSARRNAPKTKRKTVDADHILASPTSIVDPANLFHFQVTKTSLVCSSNRRLPTFGNDAVLPR